MTKTQLTQEELVLVWVKSRGSILPAKLSGNVYCGTMFGSETSRACRRLRESGLLNSKRDDYDTKFVRFFPTKKLIKIWKKQLKK